MFRKFIRGKLDAMNLPQLKAHCDIPCKIYDPHHAQVAVLTMIRMIDLIQELNGKGTLNTTEQARLIRFVSQKEEHGVILKNEIKLCLAEMHFLYVWPKSCFNRWKRTLASVGRVWL